MVRIFFKKLQTFFEMQYILQREHVLEKVNIFTNFEHSFANKKFVLICEFFGSTNIFFEF